MLLKCFVYILISSLASFLVCLLGTLITYFTQGQELAKAFFSSYIFRFNGVFVAGVGYGLLFFLMEKGKLVFNLLNNIVEFPKEDLQMLMQNQKRMSLLWGSVISVPITIIGGIILWNCGYPLSGFAKIFLAATSISLYYIGGSMMSFFIYSSKIFWYLEENENKIKLNKSMSLLHFEQFNSFFIIISTTGILALYLAFRGTLTADFLFAKEGNLSRTLLVFPIILFSAAPLLYSFYPRYVVKRIYDNNIISRITDLEMGKNSQMNENQSIKEKLEMEKLLIDIKESLTIERDKVTIFNIKDIPSILLLIIMFLQFIIPKDNVVMKFIESIFN
jgi:hypothetical protein